LAICDDSFGKRTTLDLTFGVALLTPAAENV